MGSGRIEDESLDELDRFDRPTLAPEPAFAGDRLAIQVTERPGDLLERRRAWRLGSAQILSITCLTTV
jgi:hypothetical protein